MEGSAKAAVLGRCETCDKLRRKSANCSAVVSEPTRCGTGFFEQFGVMNSSDYGRCGGEAFGTKGVVSWATRVFQKGHRGRYSCTPLWNTSDIDLRTGWPGRANPLAPKVAIEKYLLTIICCYQGEALFQQKRRQFSLVPVGLSPNLPFLFLRRLTGGGRLG